MHTRTLRVRVPQRNGRNNIQPPRKPLRGLVAGRSVGGLQPGNLGLDLGLFTPVPFDLVRGPTHHFRTASKSRVRKNDELARTMVGWSRYKIVWPSISIKVEFATASGFKPTHPTTTNQPFADCREVLGEKPAKIGIAVVISSRLTKKIPFSIYIPIEERSAANRTAHYATLLQ